MTIHARALRAGPIFGVAMGVTTTMYTYDSWMMRALGAAAVLILCILACDRLAGRD